jgi:hypothetical protein
LDFVEADRAAVRGKTMSAEHTGKSPPGNDNARVAAGVGVLQGMELQANSTSRTRRAQS